MYRLHTLTALTLVLAGLSGPAASAEESPTSGVIQRAPVAEGAVQIPAAVTPAVPAMPQVAAEAPARTAAEIEMDRLRQEVMRLRAEKSELQEKLDDVQKEAAMSAGENLGSPLELEFLQMLADSATGYNGSNPAWAPNSHHLGFERSEEKNKELIIADNQGQTLKNISYKNDDDDLGLALLLPGIADTTTYNAAMSWGNDSRRFIFMSNGSEGNYDIFLGGMDQAQLERLTTHHEKDGQAHWAPTSDDVLFISGRTGSAQVYLMNLLDRKPVQLTKGTKVYLYPVWSPNGRDALVTYGSNENHDVILMPDVKSRTGSQIPLTKWRYDDLRPMWSPDGKKLAFYSNYNEENDPKQWAIVVLDVEQAKSSTLEDLSEFVVATNVIPDIERGPAWMPDSKRIVYVKNHRKEYNPIYLADITTGLSHWVKTNTRINHDIAASTNGLIAFRSQVDQWDRIFIAKIKE